MFQTDAFSEVLDIVHVRGETAQVITAEGPLVRTVTAGKPCVYIVEQGTLELSVDQGAPIPLHQSQIALLLHGTAHTASFSALRRKTVPNAAAGAPDTDQPPREINCFCGTFTVDGDLAPRVLQSLPSLIVLDGLADNPIEWVDVVCGLVLRELGATQPGASLMVSRLLDLLLVIILRRWAQTEDSLPGWLAAAKDERIARAVSAVHADPARTLTNAALAEVAGMSLSNFAERFKQVMGQQPGAYIRAWRLDQAAEALLHSSAPIESIASRVGYASKKAFSRAFQANFGKTPSAWRAARHMSRRDAPHD